VVLRPNALATRHGTLDVLWGAFYEDSCVKGVGCRSFGDV
jgi:hypothetical protein